jgi:hypothetical protein
MTNEAKWAGRVAGWRASGLTAPAFAAGKDFSAGALRYWASRLRRKQADASSELRIAKVVAPGSLVESDTPVILEVGGVRLALRRGFDRTVLADVLATLEGRTA